MAKRMKMPYYQWQKCSPMTLVSGNIRAYADIHTGFPGAEASNDSGVIDDSNFWQFGWLLLWKRQR